MIRIYQVTFFNEQCTGDHELKSFKSDLMVLLFDRNSDIFLIQISKTRRYVENEIINVTIDYLGEVFGGVGSPSEFLF